MLGIASRFRPWGRPFHPLDLKIKLDDPNPSLLTSLEGEERSSIALAPFVLTNTAENTLLVYNNQTVVDGSNNVDLEPSNLWADRVLQAGESVNVIPYVVPANRGNFYGTARVLLRFTLYAPEAYEILNSTDQALLATNPAFKVSRSIRSTNPIYFSGYAQNN